MYETCFDKNTTVELCDSRKINIDKIKINDVIMAYDIESQTIDTAVVLNVMKHKVDLYPMITLTLSNGTQIKCTNNHPFWCNEKWTRADELRIHDVLQVYDEKNADDLKEKGLVASYYCDEHKRGFVTQEMIEEIREAVARARFRHIWGKDMPDGLPSD